MLTILVPMAGQSQFFSGDEFKFPKPFVEIKGKPMIQHVIENLQLMDGEFQFHFIVNKEDSSKYNIGNVLTILTNDKCTVTEQDGITKGAICTILLALDDLNLDEPLVISNSDQIIDKGLNEAVSFFKAEDSDAGVVCFDSIHPQWSFARVIDKNVLIETAEKSPISRHAIAGIYYYKKARYFIESAMQVIRKGRDIDGKYFISMTYNELALRQKKLNVFFVKNSEYHSFYSPEKIKEYETNKQ